MNSEIQPELDKDDGTLNIISYQRINKKVWGEANRAASFGIF